MSYHRVHVRPTSAPPSLSRFTAAPVPMEVASSKKRPRSPTGTNIDPIAAFLFGAGAGIVAFGVGKLLARAMSHDEDEDDVPGVYATEGDRGGKRTIRIGEGKRALKRARRSARENANCLGPLRRTRLLAVVADRSERRRLERDYIRDARRREAAGGPRVCNKIDA